MDFVFKMLKSRTLKDTVTENDVLGLLSRRKDKKLLLNAATIATLKVVNYVSLKIKGHRQIVPTGVVELIVQAELTTVLVF